MIVIKHHGKKNLVSVEATFMKFETIADISSL